MVHKNQNIELIVKRLTAQTPKYWSIDFHRPNNFQFEAGDWVDIAWLNQELAGGKTYSLSSSPTEPDLTITFREGLSPLKRALVAVQPGAQLRITQYGNDYGFQLRENKSSVLIAGGVGVAPFRSMLKEMYDQRSKHTVQLIYLNQNDDFLFRKELELWSSALPNLTVHYVATKELSRKKREKLITSIIADTNRQFYISGPPGMVTSSVTLLETVGVNKRHIKTDVFGGY